MTGSENRGEKQPGRVQLRTGPGRDAIAKSAMMSTRPLVGLLRADSPLTLTHDPLPVNPFTEHNSKVGCLRDTLAEPIWKERSCP